MPLAPGTHLGPYEILAPIGAGGMGEVYRARDAKLERDVALKVLPAAFANDPDRLARFEREARAVAALSHPNILAIHDFSSHEGLTFAVTELLEGETLRPALAAGPLPIRKAVDYSIQIAQGLAAAHEKGIVHRDLKPENVFVTRDGRIKILDFGLARQQQPQPGEDTHSPTIERHTDAGAVLGTVGYMSPEQVRGQAVDGRSDIFALGSVLYEMLTGRRAFQRDTSAETMTAILREDPPDLTPLDKVLPPSLERIVHHCLEKRPEERFQSARDIAFDLDAVRTASSSETVRAEAVAGVRSRRPALSLGIAVTGGIALGVLLDRAVRREGPPPLVAIRPLTHSGADVQPAVSPDAKTIAFSSNRDGTSRIWLKQLATGDEVALTEGPDFWPRFSPDGSQLLYVHAPRAIGSFALTASELRRTPVIGGTSRKIAELGQDADWSPDGRMIAFVRNSPSPVAGVLLLVPPDGEQPREVRRWPDRLIGSPRFAPDGRSIIVTTASPGNTGFRFEIVDMSGSSRALAIPPSLGVVSNAIWTSHGREILFTQSTRVRFGVSRLFREDVGSGQATPLAWMPFEVVTLDALGSGRLVADSLTSRENLVEVSLADPAAPTRWLTRGTSTDRQPVFSPDAEWVAFSSDRSGDLDIWEVSTKTGALRRLTENTADDWDPGFMRDGKLIWSSARSGHLEIWKADADGSSAQRLSDDGTDAENPTATPDGWIVYYSGRAAKGGVWRVRPDGTQAARVGPCNTTPDASPDGRWVACPDVDAHLRVLRVADGAVLPYAIDVPQSRMTETVLGRARWSPDAKRLLFVGQDEHGANGIFEQAFDPDKKDTSTTRRKVAGFDPNVEVESFAISPDGSRLVMAILDRRYGIAAIEGVAQVDRAR